MWRACELHDDGEALATEDDLVAVFQRPSFDAGERTVAVRDGGEIVALALLHGRDAARGITAATSTALALGWTERGARPRTLHRGEAHRAARGAVRAAATPRIRGRRSGGGGGYALRSFVPGRTTAPCTA